MTPIERLGIVGVGLIGGSFALATKAAGIAREVVGLGRSQANLDVALKRGIVDRAGREAAILSGADFVLLSTPVARLARSAAEIAGFIAPGAVVTDAGSVKARIVSECEVALSGHARFVGSHPIAGTEASGSGAAEVGLFRGARCVLTPVATTDPAALARVREVWEAVGMRVSVLSPEAHDQMLALTSHLPHVLAFALALAAGEACSESRDPLEFAGPSFRDATRVAASSPEMWRDILFANREAVRHALARFRERLDALETALGGEDEAGLVALLEGARQARARLERLSAKPSAPQRQAERLAKHPPDTVTILPAKGPLAGEVTPPGDKSIAHRALLFGAVAVGQTIVHGIGAGADNAATAAVLGALGVEIERNGTTVRIAGRGFDGLRAPSQALDCANSGTTMRLCAGLLAARPWRATLDGDASLRRRPMRRVIEPLTRMGAAIDSADGRPPLTVHGAKLHATSFKLEIASAQVKTALILAALQTKGTTSVAEPAASRDHTERLLPAFGARIERRSPLEVVVRGPQSLTATEVRVPGDPSAAAFWLVAASIVPDSRVTLRGVGMNPTRTGAIDVLRAMGAQISESPRPQVGDEPVADLTVRWAPLHGTVVEGETMLRAIDEFPILAIAAAVAQGETRFADGEELRVKESDRIAAVAAGFRALGAPVNERLDGLILRGPLALGGGEVDSHGDHRIAMAFAIAALVAGGPVTINGAEAIAVSDPDFFRTLAHLARGAP